MERKIINYYVCLECPEIKVNNTQPLMNFRERRVKDKVFSVQCQELVYLSPQWFGFSLQCILSVNKSQE